MIQCSICKGTNIAIRSFDLGLMGRRKEFFCTDCEEGHKHIWEARNGKYGGFVVCIKCNKTMPARAAESLFRQVCTWHKETMEQAIIKSKEFRRKRNPLKRLYSFEE